MQITIEAQSARNLERCQELLADPDACSAAASHRLTPQLSRNGMNSSLLFQVAPPLIAICLAALAGCSQSETMIGSSGPLRAFRAQAFLGWEIKIKNDSDAKYPALYVINGSTDLRHVPAHGTVKAGYVLGREIPTFYFADPPLRGPDPL
jgi:hypothetical protein